MITTSNDGIMLKAYISQDTDDPKELSVSVSKMLTGLELFRGRYTYTEVDNPEALIYGEFLNGGVFIGNIEEPIGKP